jgi:hypothetical protein
MSIKDYKAAKKEIKRLREEQVERAKTAFTEASKDLFVKFPGLDSFGWRQYTPYFNDGDECVFGVSNDEYSIIVNQHENGEDEEQEVGATPEEFKKIREAVSDFLNIFDDTDMKDMFGDHVEVTVTRKGKTETEEYSHD